MSFSAKSRPFGHHTMKRRSLEPCGSIQQIPNRSKSSWYDGIIAWRSKEFPTWVWYCWTKSFGLSQVVMTIVSKRVMVYLLFSAGLEAGSCNCYLSRNRSPSFPSFAPLQKTSTCPGSKQGYIIETSYGVTRPNSRPARNPAAKIPAVEVCEVAAVRVMKSTAGKDRTGVFKVWRRCVMGWWCTGMLSF